MDASKNAGPSAQRASAARRATLAPRQPAAEPAAKRARASAAPALGLPHALASSGPSYAPTAASAALLEAASAEPAASQSAGDATSNLPQTGITAATQNESNPADAQDEPPLDEEAMAAQKEMAAMAENNPRLKQMNVALEKFLGLVDVATEEEKLSAAIPQLASSEDLQRYSRKLVRQLKGFVMTQNVKLVQGFEIDVRMAELNDMIAEANDRIAQKLAPESEEMKDAWRPHITAAQMTLARQIPEQQEELKSLEAELKALEEENAREEESLRSEVAKYESQLSSMRNGLVTLDKTVEAISINADAEKNMHETMDILLTEVVPRG
ncbi:hypothetical protein OC845_004903 [Tilletia horrida]|nr:hypothetical protein OC845_004903 [Tilletia horrida]